MAEPSISNTKAEIRAAIEAHERYLVQAIRDAGVVWVEGRIAMIHQTLEILRRMEREA